MTLALTIAISSWWWLIPVCLTIFFLIPPIKTLIAPQYDYWGLDILMSCFWVVPILITWCVFFLVLWLIER